MLDHACYNTVSFGMGELGLPSQVYVRFCHVHDCMNNDNVNTIW